MARVDGLFRHRRRALGDKVAGVIDLPKTWLVIIALFIATEFAWISIIVLMSGFSNLFRRSILFSIILIAVIFYLVSILVLPLQGLARFIKNTRRDTGETDDDATQERENDD